MCQAFRGPLKLAVGPEKVLIFILTFEWEPWLTDLSQVPSCVCDCVYVCVARQLSSTLSCEVHGSQSGQHVTAKMMELVMNNFALSSTTVTGIPMKVGIVETRQNIRGSGRGHTIETEAKVLVCRSQHVWNSVHKLAVLRPKGRNSAVMLINPNVCGLT